MLPKNSSNSRRYSRKSNRSRAGGREFYRPRAQCVPNRYKAKQIGTLTTVAATRNEDMFAIDCYIYAEQTGEPIHPRPGRAAPIRAAEAVLSTTVAPGATP
jgi:hypothetical protein